MDSPLNGRDNRRFPRVPFSRGVRCSYRQDEVPQGELAQDLSEGGIRIRSNVFIGVGEEVAVGIKFKEDAQLVEVTGRVVWVRFNPYSESYQLGIKFAEESSFPCRSIGRYISSI